MKPVRIVAQWAEDERQTLVIVALQADDMSIATTVEAFGYVKDYDDEDRMYVRYPFVLEEYSETEALMDWGALDTRTLIDLYGRRIVPARRWSATSAASAMTTRWFRWSRSCRREPHASLSRSWALSRAKRTSGFSQAAADGGGDGLAGLAAEAGLLGDVDLDAAPLRTSLKPGAMARRMPSCSNIFCCIRPRSSRLVMFSSRSSRRSSSWRVRRRMRSRRRARPATGRARRCRCRAGRGCAGDGWRHASIIATGRRACVWP